MVERRARLHRGGPDPRRLRDREGVVPRRARRLGTFTDGTDAGWIYGTIVDGKVNTAGTVARCAGCHEHAHHERLFGLHAQT